jgi:hypothetical protein
MTNQSKTRLASCRNELLQLNLEAIPRLKRIRNLAWMDQREVSDSSRKAAAAALDPVKIALTRGRCRFCC